MKTKAGKVIFGHMHEDHSWEMVLLASLPVPKVVVVASGGDLAFQVIAAGIEVVAVDTNAAQIDLIRQKLSEAQAGRSIHELNHCGKVDHLLQRVGPVIGWIYDWPMLCKKKRLQAVTWLSRLLPLGISLIHGARSGSRVTVSILDLMRQRFESALRRADAPRNPYLQVLLGKKFGEHPPEVWTTSGIARWKQHADLLELAVESMQECLARLEPGSIGLISLSNLYDVLDPEAWDKLLAAAFEVLHPGGFVIVRSMLSDHLPTRNEALESIPLSQADASPLCPVIWIGKKRQ